MSDTIFPIGTQVHVSDGTAQPPARFNRKLSEWKHANYDGVVVEHAADSDRYTVQRKPDKGWQAARYIVQLTSGLHADKFNAIPGAPLLPVSHNTVDVDAVLAHEARAA